MTPEASPSETVPLQRHWSCESRRQFASPAATLMGFVAPLARVMIVSQVPVSIRPRHLQGLRYTLLAASSLTTLPVKAGALLRFALQRFPPPPVSPPSPGRGPPAVGASGLLDFRAVAGRGPLEPRLPDPLLGFTPPGPSLPAPAARLSRVTVPSRALRTPKLPPRASLREAGPLVGFGFHLAVSGFREVSRSDTTSRSRRHAVDALEPYCPKMTPEASPTEMAPLQRS
jgi:hypothetical protein